MKPIVIIGSGMAGYTLAREFRKLNTETPLVIISADDATNYAKPALSNALVGNKQPSQLALGDCEKMATQLNATILAKIQVTAIDSSTKQIQLTSSTGNTTQEYQSLILAVGATPIRLPIEGDGAADIHVVNSLSDYQHFRQALDQRANACVLLIGAGLIGCEFANDLIATNHDVTVVDLAPTPLGRLLPADAAKLFQEKLELVGVNFQLGSTVQSVMREGSDYRVHLANGKDFLVDVVLSAIGLKANMSLAEASGINCARGIIADELLQTNIPDIYTIGDCAEVKGHLLPFVMPIMQQARALAQTLNGNITPVHYPAMPVAVKTPAAPLVISPPPIDVKVTWQSEYLEDGLVAKASDSNGLRGFVLLGATAGKQRLELTKLVPDLLDKA